MPVVVVADPTRCSLQFDILESTFATSCDLAKTALTNAACVSYRNLAAGRPPPPCGSGPAASPRAKARAPRLA